MYSIKVRNKDGSFLAARENVQLDVFLEQLGAVDCIVSDLDGTDFVPFTSQIIRNHTLSKDVFSKAFRNWTWNSRARTRDDQWSWDRWHAYRDMCLATPQDREVRLKGILELDNLERKRMPGAQELYRMLDAHKIYCTGNISEVAQAATSFMGFDRFLSVNNKSQAMQDIIEHSSYKNYFVKGNSSIDQHMIDSAQEYVVRGEIEYCISAFMVSREKDMHKYTSDVIVGPNSWNGLITALKFHEKGHRYD